MAQMSKEYAVSLFTLGLEEGKEEQYLEQLREASALIDGTPGYAELLSSPALTREERVAAFEAAFGDSFAEYVSSFLKILCEEGRMKSLPDCLAEYEALFRESRRISPVKITSASPLSDGEKSRIEEKVSGLLKSRCEFFYSVDPSLLGGAVIEAEGKIIDGSLKKRLRDMKGVITE